MVKKAAPPENKDLVNALESIRGLLEKSETKLSAARESLQKAKQPAKPNSAEEPLVPVLDDMVMANSPDEIDDALIPVLDTRHDSIMPPPAVAPAAAGDYSTEEVLAYLDLIETSLEKQLHQSLIQAMVQAETEIKQSLKDQIQLLREEIQHQHDS